MSLTPHQLDVLVFLARTPFADVNARTRTVGVATVDALARIGLVAVTRRPYRRAYEHEVTARITRPGLLALELQGRFDPAPLEQRAAELDGFATAWTARFTAAEGAKFATKAEELRALVAELQAAGQEAREENARVETLFAGHSRG